MAPVPGPGQVTLSARAAEGGRLRLEVKNTGRQMPPGALERPGVGIRNTLARLAALYTGGASLRLENLPAGGVRATLDLPVRFTADPAPEGSDAPAHVGYTKAVFS